jgi:phosphatidylglycerol---prolipoprotein diacylglyceryl transferase
MAGTYVLQRHRRQAAHDCASNARDAHARDVTSVGYALARIAMEFFREPDSHIEQLAHGVTMGMVLSAPMLAIGIALLIHSAWMTRRLKPK